MPGIYSYHRESSKSAYATGMYGATPSRIDEAGTCSLSRRNHPRTGDPMLCLDDLCFVTYHQRPPWP